MEDKKIQLHMLLLNTFQMEFELAHLENGRAIRMCKVAILDIAAAVEKCVKQQATIKALTR